MESRSWNIGALIYCSVIIDRSLSMSQFLISEEGRDTCPSAFIERSIEPNGIMHIKLFFKTQSIIYKYDHCCNED
jgi:hypothetical protein